MEKTKQQLLTAFPAFTHRNYQLYFSSQLVSLIGTWLQQVAQGWLVLQLTQSAFWVGMVTALSSLPVFFFVLFGGVIVDRFYTKTIIMITQIAAMAIALVLGLLTVTHVITLWQVCLLAFLMGLVNAVDMPARQSFGVEMVGKKDLASAIALSSGMFNSARAIGPAVAGLLIALLGLGGVFIINAASFLPVIIALLFIKPVLTAIDKTQHPLKAITEGIGYAAKHQVIQKLLLLTTIVALFGWSYSTILPVIVKDVFHKDAAWLGLCFTAIGAGALLGSLFVSIYGKRIAPIILIVGGTLIFGMGLVVFTFVDNALFALPWLFLAGFGSLSAFATVNTSIQHLIPDAIRGRVLSVYTFCFLGLAPFGSLEIGWLAEKFGSEIALRLNAVIVVVFGAVFYFLSREIGKTLGHPKVD